jgi:cytochrome P450
VVMGSGSPSLWRSVFRVVRFSSGYRNCCGTKHRTRWADPESLHLDLDQRHLAFGHGIHFCLGAPLARMEGHVAFGSLLRRLPELRLAVPVEDLHWDHGDGLVLRGLSTLPVLPGPSLP